MDNNNLPRVFTQLVEQNCISESDILSTNDGFTLVYKSVSDILLCRDICDFPGGDGQRLECDRFFDDWFLYAVVDGDSHVYSLLKLREQEHDAQDGRPADGDTPGVTISFVPFDCEALISCLCNPDDQNRTALNREINRVVAHRGQRHHDAIKRYFVSPDSCGAYLVAQLYIRHIAAYAQNGCLELPDQYKQNLGKHSKKASRLHEFIARLNKSAERVICDNNKIYIKDPASPDGYEAAAILATHTGNTSVYSFAAEVEYHARFLIPCARIRLPFIKTSVYESAVRADMSIGDKEFEGPAPYYKPDSKIVRRQQMLHCDKTVN
ncbi:MAG: hypothetical protein IKY46_02615 [Clostridia bacterium]|nr:hypothetical protein [Clostridia bacterium]